MSRANLFKILHETRVSNILFFAEIVYRDIVEISIEIDLQTRNSRHDFLIISASMRRSLRSNNNNNNNNNNKWLSPFYHHVREAVLDTRYEY